MLQYANLTLPIKYSLISFYSDGYSYSRKMWCHFHLFPLGNTIKIGMPLKQWCTWAGVLCETLLHVKMLISFCYRIIPLLNSTGNNSLLFGILLNQMSSNEWFSKQEWRELVWVSALLFTGWVTEEHDLPLCSVISTLGIIQEWNCDNSLRLECNHYFPRVCHITGTHQTFILLLSARKGIF